MGNALALIYVFRRDFIIFFNEFVSHTKYKLTTQRWAGWKICIAISTRCIQFNTLQCNFHYSCQRKNIFLWWIDINGFVICQMLLKRRRCFLDGPPAVLSDISEDDWRFIIKHVYVLFQLTTWAQWTMCITNVCNLFDKLRLDKKFPSLLFK